MKELFDKISVELYKNSFLNLLVAIHRSPMRVYSTHRVARYVERTKQNPTGVEYDEKQVPNNFNRVVEEIERQTRLGPAIIAIMKQDRERKASFKSDFVDAGDELVHYVVTFADGETETVKAFSDELAGILAQARRIEKYEPHDIISICAEDDVRAANKTIATTIPACGA